ncbi:MAG: hypothetical protein ACO3JG_14225, partial [Luteolibacter sp.]
SRMMEWCTSRSMAAMVVSIGYRGGVGARQSSRELAEALYSGTYCWVVEADIRSFFDHIDHGWMVRMLETRIADRPLIRLIVKWLKAGVMETWANPALHQAPEPA